MENNNTTNTPSHAPSKDVADVIGLSLFAVGYVVSGSGQLARRAGARGISGSYRSGSSTGARHANLACDKLDELWEDATTPEEVAEEIMEAAKPAK